MAAVGRQSNDPIQTVSTAVNTSRTQEWHHVEINKTRDHPFFMNPMLFQPVIFFSKSKIHVMISLSLFPFILAFCIAAVHLVTAILNQPQPIQIQPVYKRVFRFLKIFLCELNWSKLKHEGFCGDV